MAWRPGVSTTPHPRTARRGPCTAARGRRGVLAPRAEEVLDVEHEEQPADIAATVDHADPGDLPAGAAPMGQHDAAEGEIGCFRRAHQGREPVNLDHRGADHLVPARRRGRRHTQDTLQHPGRLLDSVLDVLVAVFAPLHGSGMLSLGAVPPASHCTYQYVQYVV